MEQPLYEEYAARDRARDWRGGLKGLAQLGPARFSSWEIGRKASAIKLSCFEGFRRTRAQVHKPLDAKTCMLTPTPIAGVKSPF